MLGKDMPNFRGSKERSSFVFLAKVACSVGFLSCEPDIWSLYSLMAPSSHEGETHTAVVPASSCTFWSLPRVVPYPFNPLHLIFITAFAQLSALWCSQFMLVQQMIEDVCQSPFTSLLLLVYPLLYTQAFRCHPVVSCLSSFFSPCCWPHSIKHAWPWPFLHFPPDVSCSWLFLCNFSADSTLNFPVASYTVLVP